MKFDLFLVNCQKLILIDGGVPKLKKVFDCCVIGGGVVGAAIFNKVVRVGKSCLLLDKASDVATGASKANSGIVHAGYESQIECQRERSFSFPL